MTPRLARSLLWLAAIVVMILGVAWLALDRWLESAGGRAAVERSLGDALGTPVRLGGEFGVRLLPSIGVGGTEFLAGDSTGPAGGPFLRGRAYLVELALGPLWRGELRLDSIRLEGGHLDLSRRPEFPSDEPPALSAAPAWTVREVVIRDFELRGVSASAWRVSSLRVEDLAPGSDARFDLAVDDLGRLQGRFRWDPAASTVALGAAWTGVAPGRVDLDLRAALDSRSGTLTAGWHPDPPGSANGATLSLGFSAPDGGILIQALHADVAGQAFDGEGCLRTAGGTSLSLDLRAAALDLEALPGWPVDGDEPGPGPEAAVAWIEETVRLRLRVGELQSGGMRARGVELDLGLEPDCSGLASEGGMRPDVEPLQ